MAGISVQACISLILQHIGGVPLVGAIKSSIEGANPAKQIMGVGSFSLPSLNMISSALDGAGLNDMLGDVFQNPIGDITGDLTSSLTDVTDDLESTFVSLSEVEGGMLRSIKGEFAGKISLEQIDSLKENLANLGSSMPGLTDLTNKISGVTAPTFEQIGDFGLQQVASVTMSFDAIADKIPEALISQVGGLKESISGHLDSITAPLNTSAQLTSAKNLVNNLVSSLTSASNSTGVTSIVNSTISSLTSTNTSINSIVDTSKSTMSAFMTASQGVGFVSTVSGVLESGSIKSQELIKKITNPTVLQQVEDGIELQKEYNESV